MKKNKKYEYDFKTKKLSVSCKQLFDYETIKKDNYSLEDYNYMLNEIIKKLNLVDFNSVRKFYSQISADECKNDFNKFYSYFFDEHKDNKKTLYNSEIMEMVETCKKQIDKAKKNLKFSKLFDIA